MALARYFALLMLAGCFAPGLDGKFACGADGSCPPGLSCVQGVCVADGGRTDAATSSSQPAPDASTPGAATTDASTCQPVQCAPGACGAVSDGCGGSVQCGMCPKEQVCGAKTPNVCGVVCMPSTCQKLHAECGTISDGCSGTLDCGTCSHPGDTCGGDEPNHCS